MTRKQYNFCVTEAANYSSSGAYVSGIIRASIWGDAPDAPIPPERLDQLCAIYTAATRTVREIVGASGLTQTAFAECWCIPLRTVQDWCRGVAKCPLYTRLMIQQCMGMFVPPIE